MSDQNVQDEQKHQVVLANAVSVGPDVWYDCARFGQSPKSYRVRNVTVSAMSGEMFLLPIVDFPPNPDPVSSSTAEPKQAYMNGVAMIDPLGPYVYAFQGELVEGVVILHRLPFQQRPWPEMFKDVFNQTLAYDDLSLKSDVLLEISNLNDLQGLGPGASSVPLKVLQVKPNPSNPQQIYYLQQPYPAEQLVVAPY